MHKAALAITVSILILILAAASFVLIGGIFTMPGPGGPSASDTAQPTADAAVPLPETTPAAPSPTPAPSPEPETDAQDEYFTLSFVGDCTIGSSQHHKGNPYSYEAIVGDDYAFPFALTYDYFSDDYLSMANLEGTFTDCDESNGGTFVFKADSRYARVLSEGSIELVALGNNHSGDFGERGAADTMAALDSEGICHVSDDDWYIYQKDNGIKIGVYSKLYPTVDNVRRGVSALKDAGAEFIIAALHWGIEGSYQVTADQTAVGHAAIDAGAGIVYGCHPHVLQRCEEYGGGYIFYSLGNWTFGGNTAPRDRDTAIAQVTLLRDAAGSISIDGVEYIPCELSSAAGYNNYQPHPYESGSSEFLRTMSKLDGSFTGPDLTIDYSAFHKDADSKSQPEAGTTPQSGEDGGGQSQAG